MPGAAVAAAGTKRTCPRPESRFNSNVVRASPGDFKNPKERARTGRGPEGSLQRGPAVCQWPCQRKDGALGLHWWSQEGRRLGLSPRCDWCARTHGWPGPKVHRGRPGSTVGDQGPQWATIAHRGRPRSAVGDRGPQWANSSRSAWYELIKFDCGDLESPR